MKEFKVHSALIVVDDEVVDLESKAAFILKEEANKRSGHIINNIVKSNELSEEMLEKHEAVILLSSTNKNIALEKILETHRIGGLLGYPNPEGFWLKVFFNTRLFVIIRATDPHGILYGVGRLLQESRFSNGYLEVPNMDLVDEPSFGIRGMLLSSHHNEKTANRRNVYADWSTSQWEDYIKELSLWGLNTIAAIPVNFHVWKGVNPWENPPRWSSEDKREHWEKDWEVQKKIPEIVRSYGMKYGIWVPANNIFPEQVVPEMDRSGRGAYGVCPSVPIARKTILSNRRRIFEELSGIDFLFIPSGDDGGCPCDKCAPWVMTYLKLVEETKDILHQYHPQAKIWISNQLLSHKENELLCNYLRSKKPESIEYIVYGPGSDQLSSIKGSVSERLKGYEYKQFGPLSYYLKQIYAKVPSQYKIVLYPDITHITRCQYPIEGIDSAVVNVFRRYGDLIRPCETAKIFKETARYAVGCAPYSEGIYDDLNKWVISKLAWNPRSTIQDIVADYCRWHFGEEVTKELSAAIFRMEDNWKKPLNNNEEVDNVLRLLEKAESKMFDSYKNKNWRWRMLLVRAYLDYLIKLKLKKEAKLEISVHEALSRIFQNREGKDMFQELQEVINSLGSGLEYLKKNRIYNRVSLLKKEIYELCISDVPACNAINDPFYNLDWVLGRLDAALKSGDRNTAQRIIEEVINYEDPGEGGFYDDCGNTMKQPHLERGTNFADWRSFVEKGLLDPQNRPSQNDAVVAQAQNEEVVFFYQDLDPSSEYRIKVTYVQPKVDFAPRTQILNANDFQVHGSLEIPVYSAKQFVFPLPKGAYRRGNTRLFFRKISGHRPAGVSEIWIQKVK